MRGGGGGGGRGLDSRETRNVGERGTRRQCGISVLEGPMQRGTGGRPTGCCGKHSQRNTISNTRAKEGGVAVPWFPLPRFPPLAASQPNPLPLAARSLTYVCISMYKLYTADQVTASCLGEGGGGRTERNTAHIGHWRVYKGSLGGWGVYLSEKGRSGTPKAVYRKIKVRWRVAGFRWQRQCCCSASEGLLHRACGTEGQYCSPISRKINKLKSCAIYLLFCLRPLSHYLQACSAAVLKRERSVKPF